MTIISTLFFGFISAVIGIFPPGLINMTAAKVKIKEGKRAALWFVVGAILIIVLQVYLAILFAQFIGERPQVVVLLREIGCGIFTLLTVYFLAIAKTPQKIKGKIKKQRTSTRFFLGMLLSALNFFPIPYYVVVSLSLASYGVFAFESFSILVFYTYISFFSKIANKTDFFMKNMNKIIGSITGLVALLTLFNIINYYWN